MASPLLACMVLGLLAFTNAYYIDGAQEDTTSIGNNPSSGHTTCGNIQCPDNEANCVNGACVCQDGKSGYGPLACVNGNYTICSSINDPATTNLLGEFFHINSPCSYGMAEFNYYLPRSGRNRWRTWCNVRIRASNIRYRGKLAVGGVDVEVRYWDRDDYEEDPRIATFRAVGSVDLDSGNYIFQRQIKIQDGEDSDFENADSVTDDVDFENSFLVDNHKKRVRLRLRQCGTYVYFRPAAPDNTQSRTPGVLIGVNNANGQIRWRNTDRTTCMAPADQAETSIADIASATGLDKDVAANLYILENNRNAISYLPRQCPALFRTFRNCPSDALRIQAMRLCYNLLTEEHFITCYSNSAKDPPGVATSIIALFNECVTSVCETNEQGCVDAKDKANADCETQALDTSLGVSSCSFSGSQA